MGEEHNLNNLDRNINDRGYFERILHERTKTDDERDRRMEERFRSQEENVKLALQTQKEESKKDFIELQRRLDQLNHAHEQARDKERDFISREVYEKQVERAVEDMKALGNEVKKAAEPVAKALEEQDRRNNERFGKIEKDLSGKSESVQTREVQDKQTRLSGQLVLAVFAVPMLSSLITGLIVYLLTH